MDTPVAQAVYWGLSGLALTFLLLTLTPLLSPRGVRFRSTPTRDQSVTMILFVFLVGLGVFGVQKLPFILFTTSAGLAVVFQSWGPKRWHRGRVYGAYFVPLKILDWSRDGDHVALKLTWGCRVVVPANQANVEFLRQLEAEVPQPGPT